MPDGFDDAHYRITSREYPVCAGQQRVLLQAGLLLQPDIILPVLPVVAHEIARHHNSSRMRGLVNFHWVAVPQINQNGFD
jgi:hypothetical protein